MYVQIYPALKIQCYKPIPVYVHLLTSQLQVTTNHERNVRQKECPYYNQTSSPRGTKECPRNG